MTTEEKCDIIIAMLDEEKSSGKNQKLPQIDFSRIEALTEQLISTAGELRKPTISERRITVDIRSKEAIFTFIGMLIIISALSAWLHIATRPNYDRIDNDLKYRYIKMKGEASPQRIAELENLFEINRDNDKIEQLRTDIEAYERAVKEKAALDEQSRLRQQEAEQLNHEAEALKKK